MKNKILLLTIVIVISWIRIGYGEDLLSTDEGLDFLNKNPFKSWLPKIEEKIEKVQEEANIEKKEAEQQIVVVRKPIEEAKPIEEVQAPKIKLSGLVWNTDRPQAIVNDQVFSIGDTVDSSKIIDIRKDGIDVIFSDKLFTIQIEQTLTLSI